MKILCVCLGNICRSPTAEGVLKAKLSAKNLNHVRVDSAGTSAWHSGNSPDGRSSQHAKLRGYHLEGASRQVRVEDFDEFDLILAMDKSNNEDLMNLAKSNNHAEQISKIHLITDFCLIHSIDEVPDPYYKGDEGFEQVLDIIEDACDQIVKKIEFGSEVRP